MSAWAAARRGEIGTQLILGFIKDLAVDDAPLGFSRQPRHFGVPPVDQSLVTFEDRLGRTQPCVGGLDVGLRYLHRRQRQLDLLFIQFDGRPFRLEVLFDFRDEEVRQDLVLFHIVPDIDIPFLDESGHFGIDRRAFIGLDETGLSHDADDLTNLGAHHAHPRRGRHAGRGGLFLSAATGQRPRRQPACQEPETAKIAAVIRPVVGAHHSDPPFVCVESESFPGGRSRHSPAAVPSGARRTQFLAVAG